MLQDGSGFVLLDSFRHHVQNVMHNGCPQLQVKVRLHTLLCDSLCYTLGVTAWKKQSTSAVLTLLGSATLLLTMGVHRGARCLKKLHCHNTTDEFGVDD